MTATVSVTDMYMGMLVSLPNDAKLDLIGKLTASMRTKRSKATFHSSDVFACFHSDWGGEGSPEEIADGLRKSRTFNREMDSW